MGSEYYTGKIEEPFTPFSNGTEAMIWESENCERCSKAWFPKDGNWPKESTIREYVRIGKYCKFQYWMHIGWIEGSIPKSIAEQMVSNIDALHFQDCIHFSDNEDDGYKPPKPPRPDRTPPNQLVMPFYLQEIGVKEISKELV